MDDEAASQQLMDEARALNTTDGTGPAIPMSLDGASQDTTASTPRSDMRSGRKSKRKKQPAVSLTPEDAFIDSPLPTYSHTELQAFVGPSPSKSQAFLSTLPSTQIEVPNTQNEAPTIPTEAIDEHDDVLDAEEAPIIPDALFGDLKAEQSWSSQTEPLLRKSLKSRSANVGAGTDISSEDAQDALLGLLISENTATPAKIPAASRSARKRKRLKNGKSSSETPLQAYDWEAPVRNLEESPAQPFSYEDFDEYELPGEDEEDAIVRTEFLSSKRKRTSTSGKKTPRSSVGGLAKGAPGYKKRKSRADPNRNYQRDHDDDERTAAERALDNVHELGHPPDKRTSGEYTADENELLRRAIRDYQERKGLDTPDLVEIIQWNRARKKEVEDIATDQNEAETQKDSSEFWDGIRSAGLLRGLKEIKDHVRTQYHMYQRGHWSQEEDGQLRNLANKHPGKWKLISTQLNRPELDVYTRWRDYVRHGENRITKRWSVEEEENFVRVLSIVCQRIEDYRAETGKPPLDDYTSSINWHEVTREMGDTRSRLQCQSKWKLMKSRKPPATMDIEIKPRKIPEPDQHDEQLKKRPKSKAKKGCEVDDAIGQLDTPGPDDMLWGDRSDLVTHIVEQTVANGLENDTQIVWQDIAEKMDHTWSVRTLQTTYKELLELIDANPEDLIANLTAVCVYIGANHKHEEEERYATSHRLDVDENHAPISNSSKKRMRQSGVSPVSLKRKKATLSTPEVFKSKELVTDSDNAESEPET